MVAMFIFLDAVFLICRIGIEVFDEDIAKEFLMEEEKELTEGSEWELSNEETDDSSWLLFSRTRLQGNDRQYNLLLSAMLSLSRFRC